LETSVRVSADLLTRLMLAANFRYKLGFFMTAGWDSRLLLAAAKKIAGRIFAYTMLLEHMTEQHHDVAIPKSISKNSEGIVWELIDCNTKADPEFYRLCTQSVDFFHEESAKIIFAITKHFPQDMLAVKGNCSEIARCMYYIYGSHDDIVSPSQLAALEPGWEKVPFIVEYLGQWLRSAVPICMDTNMDILDLFYWEHRMGSWLPQSWLEKDIAQESFSPYNCRTLLTMMLGVPTKYRRAWDYRLYQRMIKYLWPELSNWPINPKTLSFTKKLELYLHQLLLNLGIYSYVRRLYRFLYRVSHTPGSC
jgi:hypothetical protein